MQVKGSTAKSAMLIVDSNEGAKEQAAIESFDQATSYLCLGNNIQIGVEVANILTKRLQVQTERWAETDMPPELALTMSQVKTNF